MTTTEVEYVYNTLTARLDAQDERLNRLYAISERAETAGGMASSTLASAPLLATGGVSGGDMLFITDGRKVGEGALAGTGVPAYYNPATDQWYRMSDDTAVVT